VTYAAVAVLLTVVAGLASWLPARRASAVDPAEALAIE
jgi:ABC-type lipoprotein release transport system permease subunit